MTAPLIPPRETLEVEFKSDRDALNDDDLIEALVCLANAQGGTLYLHNPDRFALQLGNNILGGNGFASRLMADIRVKHGYAYGADSEVQFGRSRSVFYVQYGSDPDKVEPVDKLVLDNIKAMQQTPVSEGELGNARQYEIRSIPLSVSSVNRIARGLLTWSYNGEPLDQPMVAAGYYLKLTADDVQKAFARYLHTDNLMQVVQGPQPAKH